MTAVRQLSIGTGAGALAGGGEHPALPGDDPGTAAARLWLKAEWLNPGRQREGPRGARHPARRPPPRRAAGQAAARCLQWEHRDRLRHAGRGGGGTDHHLPSRQRQPRAARLARGLRRRGHRHRPPRGHRGRGPAGARARGRESPTRYFYADQYSNPANPQAHRETTGPEIWAQTGGRVTHFVAAMGTTGTMMGTGGYLKERNPAVRLVGVQPDSPFHGLEGLKHLATTSSPARALRSGGARRDRRDSDRDWPTGPRAGFARESGILVGWSAGAALAAGLDIAGPRGPRRRWW